MATIAYTLDGADAATRPVTFVLNGGPGAASAWLHLGALGPWRLDMRFAPSAPPLLQDNAETWLDFTDLVFIDSDVVWQPADLMRLLAWPVPLVAGVYQRKSSKLDFAVKFGTKIGARGELVTAERAGPGFMRIRRDCLE